MSPGPTVRGRRLAAELRRLRESMGLTIDQAAVESGISKSTISRLENALTPAKQPQIWALVHAYGIDEDGAADLVELSRTAAQRGWWRDYRGILTNEISVYIGFETEAKTLREYESMIIPGLLQTEAYATEIISAFRGVQSDEEIDKRVEVRLKRQSRLDELESWFIVEEATLRRPTGGRRVMRDQLEHLLSILKRRNVTFQVVPQTVGAHPGMSGSFSIFDFTGNGDAGIAYTETIAGEIWLDTPEQIDLLAHFFDQLRATALGTADSSQLVQQIMEDTK